MLCNLRVVQLVDRRTVGDARMSREIASVDPWPGQDSASLISLNAAHCRFDLEPVVPQLSWRIRFERRS